MEHLNRVMQSQAGEGLDKNQPPKNVTDPASTEAVKNSAIFWEQYGKEADLYDTEMVNVMTGDLDTLLIFAGLFSAVNTAFIVDAYQGLKPDPMNDTNNLLRQIIQNLNNATFKEAELAGAPMVSAPTRTIVINQLFFSSLSCSILAAFGAVLAKQWLNEYRRSGKYRSPFFRGIRRHQKFLGMQSYQLEFIIQTLPTLLQLSLFLFLVALALFLLTIDKRVAAVVLAFTGVGFIFYSITTIISIKDSTSPFSTRLSAYLSDFLQSRKTSSHPNGTHPTMDPVDNSSEDIHFLQITSECVAWMKENATSFNSTSAMTRTAALLPADLRRQKKLMGEDVGPAFVTSALANQALELGLSNGMLKPILGNMQDIILDWEPTMSSSATIALVSQLLKTFRFIVTNDNSSVGPVLTILSQFTSWSSGSHYLSVSWGLLGAILEDPLSDSTTIRATLGIMWAGMKRMEIAALMELLSSDGFRVMPGKMLETTMWLDGNWDHYDPDEDMMRFRLLWNHYDFIRAKSHRDYGPYESRVFSLATYLRRWIHSRPDLCYYQSDILLSDLIKIVEASRSPYGPSVTSLEYIGNVFAKSGHIGGAEQWIAVEYQNDSLGVIEILSPCVWAFYNSTYKAGPLENISISEAYFQVIISVLEVQPGTLLTSRIVEEMSNLIGVELGNYAMPRFFLSLCWFINEQKAYLKSNMFHILSVLEQMGHYMMENPSPADPVSKEKIDEAIQKIMGLFEEIRGA